MGREGDPIGDDLTRKELAQVVALIESGRDASEEWRRAAEAYRDFLEDRLHRSPDGQDQAHPQRRGPKREGESHDPERPAR